MACQSCRQRAKLFQPAVPKAAAAAPMRAASQEDAMLVRYTGAKAGSMPYRGPSGTMYWFAANEGPKYVLGRDVEMFKRYPNDFEIIEKNPQTATSGDEPVLTAAGPPKQ